MMEFFLTIEGYSVVSVMSSPDLLEVIKREDPCLIVLDLWMPVVSGDEILKTLRESEAASQLPVIVFSASSDGETVARQSGADMYFAKPFDHKEFISAVKMFCSPAVT